MVAHRPNQSPKKCSFTGMVVREGEIQTTSSEHSNSKSLELRLPAVAAGIFPRAPTMARMALVALCVAGAAALSARESVDLPCMPAPTRHPLHNATGGSSLSCCVCACEFVSFSRFFCQERFSVVVYSIDVVPASATRELTEYFLYILSVTTTPISAVATRHHTFSAAVDIAGGQHKNELKTTIPLVGWLITSHLTFAS